MLARGDRKLKVPGRNPGSPAWAKESKCSEEKRGVYIELNSLLHVLILENFSRYSSYQFSLGNHESTPVLVLCVQCCAAERPWHGSSGVTY